MRTFRFIFIVFQLVWLNVILPGHTRGSITMPGASSCCEPKPASCCEARAHNSEHDQKHVPTEKDKSNCAFCYLAARMSTPPAIDMRLPELGLLCLLPVPPPATVESSDAPTCYYGRGPPALLSISFA